MTPTEKGRRFDALCHGESNRSLATMVVNRESDLEELRAENDGLRNDADLLRAMLSQVQTEKRCHMAENDKLRDERREYQATIDSLVDECADHKAENDRLWDYIAHKRYLQDFARLVDENSKLRKLVRDMWEGYNDPRCEECHLKDTPTCADCPICAREASVIDRMRELGVEL